MLGRPVIRFDAVASTMDVLADLAALGAPEGTIVIADYQSAGRGRSGREWTAPPRTSLLYSILLRPELPIRQLTPLSLLVADAIVATLGECHGVQAEIKWPNDVLIKGKKVSGVLAQVKSQVDGKVTILGVGVNANILTADLPSNATSLLVELGEPVDHNALMWRFLNELESRYQDLLSSRIEQRWLAIRNTLAMLGDSVTVKERHADIHGILQGIDDEGALLLDQGGVIRRVVAGDLTRGPRPDEPPDAETATSLPRILPRG
ncbi:MAG TPA: biotin--[acetyl-CoA-carboxylase] ligase [Thermomicrobiales bacterium]|nr:biotin--[acetyl-CoA-carboxylase] ligase [Thermomicrobiales bacterium]